MRASWGLSERRWEEAQALLMAARIHDGDDITEPDFAVAVQRLAAATTALQRRVTSGRW